MVLGTISMSLSWLNTTNKDNLVAIVYLVSYPDPSSTLHFGGGSGNEVIVYCEVVCCLRRLPVGVGGGQLGWVHGPD